MTIEIGKGTKSHGTVTAKGDGYLFEGNVTLLRRIIECHEREKHLKGAALLEQMAKDHRTWSWVRIVD